MYSSNRAKTITKKDIAFLAGGIHEDAFLIATKYETTANGNKFIEFKFEKDSRIMTHTEWEPTKGEMTTEVFEEKCDKQFSRIEQILKCFYKEDELEFIGANFSEFAEWVCKLLSDEKVKQVPLKVKVIYNDKGYTTLPKYAKYTFIEPMSLVLEGKSKVTKLGIDNFEKPVADVETSNSNPFKVVAATIQETSNPNGLPF